MDASSEAKLINEELSDVFGAELGGLAEIGNGDKVAMGFPEGSADAAQKGAGVALALAGDVAGIFGIDSNRREERHNYLEAQF